MRPDRQVIFGGPKSIEAGIKEWIGLHLGDVLEVREKTPHYPQEGKHQAAEPISATCCTVYVLGHTAESLVCS